MILDFFFIFFSIRAMGAYMRNKKKHDNNYSYAINSVDLVKLEIYTKCRKWGRPTSQMGADLNSPK